MDHESSIVRESAAPSLGFESLDMNIYTVLGSVTRWVGLLMVSLLAACHGVPCSPPEDWARPDLSVVHLSGALTQVPNPSQWPESIKVGTPFEYWAVVDNRLLDSNPNPSVGLYRSTEWPARYDLVVGGVSFSSDVFSPPSMQVGIHDNYGPNDDGYVIVSGYHTVLPDAPGLKTVSFNIGLRTRDRDVITNDRLPLRAIDPARLDGGAVPHFRGAATGVSDGSDQTIGGRVTTFEVFQAYEDTEGFRW